MDDETVPNWGKAALKLFGVLNGREKKSDTDADDSSLPFGLRDQMMSDDKAVLYRALVAALAADAVIFAKVRLADFLFVVNGGNDLKHAIKMDRKHVDFLLCDPFTMHPVAVVELTYPEEPNEKPLQRDPFVTRALKTAGISLLKVEQRPSYPIHELRNAMLSKIGGRLAEAKSKGRNGGSSEQFNSTIVDLGSEHDTNIAEG